MEVAEGESKVAFFMCPSEVWSTFGVLEEDPPRLVPLSKLFFFLRRFRPPGSDLEFFTGLFSSRELKLLGECRRWAGGLGLMLSLEPEDLGFRDLTLFIAAASKLPFAVLTGRMGLKLSLPPEDRIFRPLTECMDGASKLPFAVPTRRMGLKLSPPPDDRIFLALTECNDAASKPPPNVVTRRIPPECSDLPSKLALIGFFCLNLCCVPACCLKSIFGSDVGLGMLESRPFFLPGTGDWARAGDLPGTMERLGMSFTTFRRGGPADGDGAPMDGPAELRKTDSAVPFFRCAEGDGIEDPVEPRKALGPGPSELGLGFAAPGGPPKDPLFVFAGIGDRLRSFVDPGGGVRDLTVPFPDDLTVVVGLELLGVGVAIDAADDEESLPCEDSYFCLQSYRLTGSKSKS